MTALPLLVALGLVTVLSSAAAPVTALAFNRQGNELISGGSRQLQLHDPTNGTVIGSVACPLPRIASLAFHPGGGHLAIAGGVPGERGEVLLMDWKSRKIIQRLAEFRDLATSLAFASNRLAAASADGSLQVYSFEPELNPPLTRPVALKGHAGPVLAVAISPDGHWVVSGSADRSLKLWSAVDGKLVRTFNHHTEAIQAVAFRPPPPGAPADDEAIFCASGGDDQTVRIWQPRIGRMVRIIRQHEGPVLALVFSPDGGRLYSAGREGLVRQFDPGSDQVAHQWKAHPDWIYALALHPSGRTLASGDWNGQVKVWRTDGSMANSR